MSDLPPAGGPGSPPPGGVTGVPRPTDAEQPASGVPASPADPAPPVPDPAPAAPGRTAPAGRKRPPASATSRAAKTSNAAKATKAGRGRATTAPAAAKRPRAAGGASAPAASVPALPGRPQRPLTLAIDIGGTGLKASVLDAGGAMVADRVAVRTTYPCSPATMVDDLVALVAPLPPADRVSAGFPGMVREGKILSAPHFVTMHGPGTTIDPHLVKGWASFDLAAALSARLGKPTRVANDADVQGAAVVKGDGLEVVVTLGTGVGTAFFYEGRLLPHLEFAHHPFLKGETYNENIGDAARKQIGNTRWNKRVRKAIATLRALAFFDHCYIGGGNSKRLHGNLGADVSIVDNSAGILGGIRLWDESHIGV